MAVPTEHAPTETWRRSLHYIVQLLTALALLASTFSAQQAKDSVLRRPLETMGDDSTSSGICLPRRPGLDTRFMYAAWYPMPTKPRTISSYKIPRLAFL